MPIVLHSDPSLDKFRVLAHLLDSAFRVPGTREFVSVWLPFSDWSLSLAIFSGRCLAATSYVRQRVSECRALCGNA